MYTESNYQANLGLGSMPRNVAARRLTFCAYSLNWHICVMCMYLQQLVGHFTCILMSCACNCNNRLCLLVMCLSAKQGGGAKARGDLGNLHEGAGLYGVRGPEQAAFRHELG